MLQLSQTDESILDMINILRVKQRKRPTINDIFEGINENLEDSDKISFPVFKDVMSNLQSLNVIYDGGKDGKQSFYINEDEMNARSKTKINDVLSFYDLDDANENNSMENINKFIDDKFYEILINRIKMEVKNEINMLVNNDCLLDGKVFKHEIIDILKTELDTLKNELKSKDMIIDMLIKEKSPSKSNDNNNFDANNNDPFVNPKKTVKLDNKQDNQRKGIQLNNKFDLLNTMPVTTMDEDNDNAVNDTSNNGIVKSIRKYRSTTIIGDSIIKDIKPHKMRKAVTKGDRVYLKSFPGATVNDMIDYVKPSIKFNPDLLVLHIGANDIRTMKSAEVIAADIIDLANSIKTSNNDIIISGLIVRDDEHNTKSEQVNEFLINKCVESNFFYLDNSNISARKHLNSSGLHLNYAGTTQLANNVLDCINL